jgi:hypothetical protein
MFETLIRLRAVSIDEELEFVGVHAGLPDSTLNADSELNRGFYYSRHRRWGRMFTFPMLPVLSLSLDELWNDPRPFSVILLA